MKVDFHVHTTASFDSRIEPDELLEIVPSAGLDAIAVTDHNAFEGVLELMELGPSFLVIPGEEIETAEGEIIGLFLSEPIEPGLSPEETVESIRAQGGVVVVPHPFDRFRSSAIERPAIERIARSIDAVEGLNGRNLMEQDDEIAREWAAEAGIATIAGSDAHSPAEVGRVFTEIPEFRDAAGLLAALAQARPLGRRSGIGVHLVTKWDKWRRRK